MAPIIHCVRHAQGYHNLSVANHSMPDPSLTPFGESQCESLSNTFPHHSNTSLLVCSPLRRTIYTTLLSFTPEIARGVPVIALPEVQETADVPCDTGTDIDVLKREMEGTPVDLSRVENGWNSKSGRWASLPSAIQKRAKEARQWLRARPEEEIVLVTHGGFLHYFTEDWSDYNEKLGTGWTNVETRSYQFIDPNDDNAPIVETKQSRETRHANPLLKIDRHEIRESATKTWEEGGFEPIQAKV